MNPNSTAKRYFVSPQLSRDLACANGKIAALEVTQQGLSSPRSTVLF